MEEGEIKKGTFAPNTAGLPLTVHFANLPKAIRRPVIISAPKEELVTEIARLCGRTKMTARRWVYGYAKPCLAEKEKIAALLQCSVEDLFPPETDNTTPPTPSAP